MKYTRQIANDLAVKSKGLSNIALAEILGISRNSVKSLFDEPFPRKLQNRTYNAIVDYIYGDTEITISDLLHNELVASPEVVEFLEFLAGVPESKRESAVHKFIVQNYESFRKQ